MRKIILLSLVVSACAPSVVVKNSAVHSPSKAYEPFVIFEVKDSVQFTKDQVLSDIQVSDAGFTVICDYETVCGIAAKRAKEAGANAIKVYEHKLPNLMGSSCHRIKATALRLEDIWKYEKTILWYPERKLQLRDFKGSTQDRPFRAATAAYFSSTYAGTPISGKITVKAETLFDCDKSYFKPDGDTAFVLRHEQLHFDIAELYARKFVNVIRQQINSFKELEANYSTLFNQTLNDLHKEQDKYDYEVYNDVTKQAEWDTRITKQLVELQDVATKEVIIPYHAKK